MSCGALRVAPAIARLTQSRTEHDHAIPAHIGHDCGCSLEHAREPLINEVGEWNRESCHLGFSD
ncbi:hypothetical protein CVV70_21105 [Ralstonia solanacearum]|nr:hypothetical protein B7R79_14990 [Ralstonia solanacearum]PNQ29945.1 hypothetical protein CVS51_20895 [Ralstonia solanacearum]PNQ34134.1 hypothetical protein CVV71_20235 [Ralstonia solanacearum]PNQ36411.1 hypothetical protein CVT21_22110 [Ralstonia solanacearum]PNQ45509.1 hypothetical protein CVV70_21105 [Ralstonia solanacearum]